MKQWQDTRTANDQTQLEATSALCMVMCTSHPEVIEPFLDEEEKRVRTLEDRDTSVDLSSIVEWSATAAKTLYNRIHSSAPHAFVS